MSQEYSEIETSFDDCYGSEGFCETENEFENEAFIVLSANDVVDLMKNETEKVREVVNVGINGFLKGKKSSNFVVASSSAIANAPHQMEMGHRLVSGKILR